MPEPPQIDPDASPEERKRQLKEATLRHKRELDKDQEDILESISEEHGGDLVETLFSITPEHTATIETKVSGELLERMERIEETMNRWEGFNPEKDDPETAPPISDLGRAADEAAAILDHITAESEYNKQLFYEIYRREDLEVLGEILKNAFDAIEEEQKRMRGAVEGFRQE